MTHEQILEELKRLTSAERLQVAETALELVRQEIEARNKATHRVDRSRELAAAAAALQSDYERDGELTIFTTLDGEDFSA